MPKKHRKAKPTTKQLVVLSDTSCAEQLSNYFAGNLITEHAISQLSEKDEALRLLIKNACHFSEHNFSLATVVYNYNKKGLVLAALSAHAGNMYKLDSADALDNLKDVNNAVTGYQNFKSFFLSFYTCIRSPIYSLKHLNGKAAKSLNKAADRHIDGLYRIACATYVETGVRFNQLFKV